MPEPIVADTTKRFIPFYSKRTLEEVHMLVKELDDGMAVYVMKDRRRTVRWARSVRGEPACPTAVRD